MKPIFAILIFIATGLAANAQKADRGNDLGKGMGDKYVRGYSKNACLCVVNKNDGKLTIYQNGKEVNSDVQLGSAKITATGILKKERGAERMLVDGNCISEKGTITMQVK